jgi:hypothetical protein
LKNNIKKGDGKKINAIIFKDSQVLKEKSNIKTAHALTLNKRRQ